MLSASIVAGATGTLPVVGVVVGLVGALEGGGVAEAPASTLIALRLKYWASDTTFSTRLPALRLTPGLPTHWNVFQLPVRGTATEPVAFTPSTSMWKDAGEVWLFDARTARS